MKISVITICYNEVDVIKKTIESVIGQTYNNIELIIIDGGSKDGTLDIINEYKKKYPIILISEKDNGIYDAMNKGAEISSGEYLNFMNAGDYFYDKKVVEDVTPHLDSGEGIVYGDTEVRYEDFKVIKKNRPPSKLWKGPVNHQSSFIKREVMLKYKYNTDNKIVADFEFFLNAYYNNEGLKKVDRVIASFDNTGLSQIKDKQVILDSLKTVKKFRPGLSTNIYYQSLKIKPYLKKIFPRKLFKKLAKLSS